MNIQCLFICKCKKRNPSGRSQNVKKILHTHMNLYCIFMYPFTLQIYNVNSHVYAKNAIQAVDHKI